MSRVKLVVFTMQIIEAHEALKRVFETHVQAAWHNARDRSREDLADVLGKILAELEFDAIALGLFSDALHLRGVLRKPLQVGLHGVRILEQAMHHEVGDSA